MFDKSTIHIKGALASFQTIAGGISALHAESGRSGVSGHVKFFNCVVVWIRDHC